MNTIVSRREESVRGRLGSAVHRHRPVSPSGIQERLFTLLFSGLVYPQIWEDPVIDMEAMALEPHHHIVTIASGGCNAMSYLTSNPAEISAVDLNATHVALNNLKITAAQQLPDYEHFHRFFARADDKANIKAYETYLRPHLDDRSRTYWDSRSLLGRRRISMFARGFYRFGLLGRFIGTCHLMASLYGIDFRPLLEARTLAEQKNFFDRELRPVFERGLIRWITDKPSSLFGLGIPPSQFHSLAGGRAMHEVLEERLERLACGFLMTENYFAWQAFARRYSYTYEGPLPPYLQPQNFEIVRERASRITITNTSFTEYLKDLPEASADRYILLDAQDWMTDVQLEQLWREITRTARPGGRILFRTADLPSLAPGRISTYLLNRWDYLEEESLRLTAKDRSSIYGGFHVYRLRGADEARNL